MSTEDTSLTPDSLTQLFANVYLTEEETKVLRIRGVYLDQQGKMYGDGFYYDKLKDKESGNTLTLKVTKDDKRRLSHNTPYELEGVINRKLADTSKELGIQIHFQLLKILGEEAQLDDTATWDALKVIRARFTKPYYNIDLLIRGCYENNKRPRIALIFGKTAKTDTDVLHSADERLSRDGQPKRYELIDNPINITNKEEIIDALRKLDSGNRYDLIAIFRGGGNKLEVFDDLDVARAVLSMNTPLVTGIGHATDTPLIEAVADRAFITPTALGDYLKNTAEKAIKDLTWVKGYHKEREQLYQTIKSLQSTKPKVPAPYNPEKNEDKSYAPRLEVGNRGTQAIQSSNSAQYKPTPKAPLWLGLGVLIGLLAGMALSYFLNPFGLGSPETIPTTQQSLPVNTQPSPDMSPTNANMSGGNIRRRKQR